MSIHKQIERLKRFYEALRRGGMTGRQFRELGPYAPAGYNANSFWGATMFDQIQNAVNTATADGVSWVFLPEYMSGVDLGPLSNPGGVVIINEGDFGNIINNITNITNIVNELQPLVNRMDRYLEFRAYPVSVSDAAVESPIKGYSRWESTNSNVLGIIGAYLTGGVADTWLKYTVDGRRSFLVKPTNTITHHSDVMLRPYNLGSTLFAMNFSDTFPGYTGATDPVYDDSNFPRPLAWSISTWVRKQTAGESSTARFTIGFQNTRLILPSATNARIGLVGDGAGGFRFGSVNCPDGLAAGENASTDIDTGGDGYIQPAELVAPGANWFHVKIKMVPPQSASVGGKVGCYLNGTLVKTFTNALNFPRGGGGSNWNYDQVECGVKSMADTNGVSGLTPGVYLHDIRWVISEDLSL